MSTSEFGLLHNRLQNGIGHSAMENVSRGLDVNLTIPAMDTAVHAERDLVLAFTKALFVCLLFMSSLAANLLVFAVFYHKPALLNASNKLLLHLTAVQCVLLLTLIPLWTASIFHLRWYSVPHVCQLAGAATNALFTVGTYNVMLVAMDRCYAITQPLHYTRIVTTRRLVAALVLVWIMAISVSILPMFGWGKIAYDPAQEICIVAWSATDVYSQLYSWLVISLCFIVPLIIIVVVYSIIYTTARRALCRSRRHSLTPDLVNDVIGHVAANRRSSAASITQYMCRRRSSAGTRSLTSLTRDDLLAARTVILSLASFVICWAPYYALNIMDILRAPAQLPAWPHFLALYLVLLTCLNNPLVYVFRSKVIKDALCVGGYTSLVLKLCPCVHKHESPVLLYRPFPTVVRVGHVTYDPSINVYDPNTKRTQVNHIICGTEIDNLDHVAV